MASTLKILVYALVISLGLVFLICLRNLSILESASYHDNILGECPDWKPSQAKPCWGEASAKFALVHSGPELSKRLSKLIRCNRLSYAKAHGYLFCEFDQKLTKGVNPHFGKMVALQRSWNQAKWLMWIDADAVITDKTVKLEDIVATQKADSHYDLILPENFKHSRQQGITELTSTTRINNGVFLIRTSDWSSRFVKKVLDSAGFMGDNSVFDTLQRTNWAEMRNHLVVVPWMVMNSPWRHWQPGDFIWHAAGMASKYPVMEWPIKTKIGQTIRCNDNKFQLCMLKQTKVDGIYLSGVGGPTGQAAPKDGYQIRDTLAHSA
jgi:hypothetical protein